MLFNSIDFAIFLPIVFLLYWFVFRWNLKLQNFLIVVASYLFYGWWDWRFLSLILLSTAVDFYIGLQISKQENQTKRKFLLWISILFNLGSLAFFKYYNFFIANFIAVFSFCGMRVNANSLNIVLPVGISFYTFQTLSYTIDIYKRKFSPTRDFIAFSAFVSFFPQLVAGPIERASNLLPQFLKKRKIVYNKAIDGLYQILWGLFKKIVIADNAAELVNTIFSGYSTSGSVLFIGAFLFAFQIYGDFSGYSDIAIGTAKLFGFDLMTNFRFPYFSRNIAEFWKRWHISLSTWFRDYLYMPLGGGKGSILFRVRNIFITFIVSGFWHGAKWTFVIWGALNAFFYLPVIFYDRKKKNPEMIAIDRHIPSFHDFVSIMLTFVFTLIAWILFRADSVKQAISYLSYIFSYSLFSVPKLIEIQNTIMIITLFMIVILILFEWTYRKREYVFEDISRKNLPTQIIVVVGLVSAICIFGGNQQTFIYFQF